VRAVGDTGVRIVHELGLDTWFDGPEQRARATVVEPMLVPGTANLRTSVVALWADIVTGNLAVVELSPRVPVTLELGLDLYREPAGLTDVYAVGRVAKAGRSVVVSTVEFTDVAGEPVGVAHGSFMAAPDETLTFAGDGHVHSGVVLSVPFAQRASCERVPPAAARIPVPPGGGNLVGTLNGGLLALVAEEAALAASDARGLSHLALRYLRPVRLGPALARAEVVGEVANIEIIDEGDGDRLAVLATAHLWT
jgi:acyl-coenzyme A thioesterase PaaI-like protein